MQNVCTRALCAKVTVQLSEVTMIFAVMKINLSRQSRSSIKKTRSFKKVRVIILLFIDMISFFPYFDEGM